MKKYLMAAAALMTGAAVAQTAPVAQPAPAVPTAAPAPTAHPMRDKVTTRDEAVQMVRRHFGEMDANKDGTVTTAEMDAARGKRFEDFKAFDGGHAMVMGDPNAAFDRLDTNKDSYISREENLRGLSRLVWKNIGLYSARLDAEIAKGLLRGLSAPELAKVVRDFIHPDVRGGVNYAAMRLARTEINNAFHQTAIRYTREMPWVEGYQWHLSNSHPRTDICNSYANESHGHGGRGLHSKTDVPSKPHPQCLCYVTPVTHDSSVFYKRLRSGAYDRYIRDVERSGVFEETDDYTPTRWQTIAGAGAKAVAVTAFSSAARRYLSAA